MLEAGAVDCLQADVTRCEGISGFLRVAALCQARSLELSAHCAPSIHAHPCCAVVPLRHLEYFHDHVRVERMLFDGVLEPVDGVIRPDLSRLATASSSSAQTPPATPFEQGANMKPTKRCLTRTVITNLRAGRMQRTLAAATALSAPPLAFEIYLEHYKGSFGSKWMWTPIVLTPPLTAAAIAGIFSERAAKTVLRRSRRSTASTAW